MDSMVCLRSSNLALRMSLEVKNSKAQEEQMFSGLPPATDIHEHGWHVGSVPQADLDLADPVLASLTCPAETLAAQSSSCLGILDWGLVLFQRGAYRLRS